MIRARLVWLAASVLVALLLPAPAFAHVANIEYRSPLPVWLYAVAGAVAVLASAPAAALAVRGRGTWTSRPFYRHALWREGRSLGVALASVLLVLILVGGLFNDAVGFYG